MDAHAFDAEILPGRGGGAYVDVPLDVPEVFGTRGRVPVKATFDGHPYRGSVAPMAGRHVLGVTKAVRSAVGKDVGDTVRVVLRRDDEERTVEVPPELDAELRKDATARRNFEGLSYTHRKEYARWVGGAQRQETRLRRAGKAREMLARGERPR